jgi:hypothetical protein
MRSYRKANAQKSSKADESEVLIAVAVCKTAVDGVYTQQQREQLVLSYAELRHAHAVAASRTTRMMRSVRGAVRVFWLYPLHQAADAEAELHSKQHRASIAETCNSGCHTEQQERDARAGSSCDGDAVTTKECAAAVVNDCANITALTAAVVEQQAGQGAPSDAGVSDATLGATAATTAAADTAAGTATGTAADSTACGQRGSS